LINNVKGNFKIYRPQFFQRKCSNGEARVAKLEDKSIEQYKNEERVF
jgi:hypothetical protein